MFSVDLEPCDNQTDCQLTHTHTHLRSQELWVQRVSVGVLKYIYLLYKISLRADVVKVKANNERID